MENSAILKIGDSWLTLKNLFNLSECLQRWHFYLCYKSAHKNLWPLIFCVVLVFIIAKSLSKRLPFVFIEDLVSPDKSS